MSNENINFGDINWADFQKKYFDALMAFKPSSSFASNSAFDNSFWNSAMEQWWKMMKNNSSATQHENIFEKVIEQSRNYYFLGEQFSSLIDGMSKFNSNSSDVSSFINKKFEELQSMISQSSNHFNWGSFANNFEMPFLDVMNKGASNDIFGFMNQGASNDMFDIVNMFDGINPAMKEMRNKFLSMPGIGYSREMQEKIQELMKLGAIYHDNYLENQTVMNQLSQDALELMREKILRMSQKGEEFDSMRQIYDLWVESNEKVYADYAFTDEYSELNGRLINSQMAFMKLSQEVNEDILTAMNMPTNRAINELERRQYELRKTVKTLEAEIKSLKESISENKSSTKSKPASSASRKAAKKKVSKKKVVTKKATGKKVAKKKASKKKATNKNRSKKNDVIEIKF